MSEGFERLKTLGVEKIHHDTHIAKSHIKSLLEEEFGVLNRVQLFGFISILSREYHIDLSDFKEMANNYYVNRPSVVGENHSVFVVPKKRKSYRALFIILGLLLFFVVAFLTLSYASQNSTTSVQNSVTDIVKKDFIEKKLATEPLKKVIIEEKVEPKIEKVIEKVEQEIEEIKPVEVVKKSEDIKKKIKFASPIEERFTISPKSRVWFGYINLNTQKKYSKTIRKPISLDVNEDYLLVLGHSGVNIDINDKKFSYKTKKSLRLLYRDGKLSKISVTEFKELNRGRKW